MTRLLFILAAICATAVNAQRPSHVEWTATATLDSRSGGTVTITASIDNGWHIFGTEAAPQGADAAMPQLTEITFDPVAGLHFDGPAVASHEATVGFDQSLKLNLPMWEGSVSFTRHFTIESNAPDITLAGGVAYMACSQRSCMPPATWNFSIPIKVATGPSDSAEESIATPETPNAKTDQPADSAAESETAGDDGPAAHPRGWTLACCLALGFLGGLGGGFLAAWLKFRNKR